MEIRTVPAIDEAKPQRATTLQSLFQLSLWQLRHTWRHTLLIEIGMMITLVCLCVGPCYMYIALQLSLQDFVHAEPSHSMLLLQGRSSILSQEQIQAASRSFNEQLTRRLGGTIATAPAVFAQSPGLPLLQGDPKSKQPLKDTNGAYHYADMRILLNAFPEREFTSHIHIIEGRFPHRLEQPAGDQYTTEIMLTPAVAQARGLSVGDSLFFVPPSYTASDNVFWILHVVGLFQPIESTDAFWEADTLQVGNENLFTSNSYFAQAFTSTSIVFDTFGQLGNAQPITLYWRYHFDESKLDPILLPDLVYNLRAFQSDVTSTGIIQVLVSSSPLEDLTQFTGRIRLIETFLRLFLLLLTAVLFLFVILMIQTLIEQRTDAMAFLRSRGASRSQLFALLAFHYGILLISALIVTPFIAFPLVQVLFHWFLPLDAYDLFIQKFMHSSLVLGHVWFWFSAAVALLSAVVLLMLFRSTRSDVFTQRKELGRPTQLPFWQRFYIDVLLMLLALIGYGYISYAMQAAAPDGQIRLQIFVPVLFCVFLLLMVALVLVLLRCIPMILRWMERLVQHYGSVSIALTFSQSARLPQQMLRSSLFFIFAIAWLVFCLIFVATQEQRMQDLATFQVGADVSGGLQETTVSLSQRIIPFTSLPAGVDGISLGSIRQATVYTTSENTQIAVVKAVDTRSFARVASWDTAANGSLPTLMKLISTRKTVQQPLPVVVDADMWTALDLDHSPIFTLRLTFTNPAYNATLRTTSVHGTIPEISFDFTVQAVAMVPAIPTLYNHFSPKSSHEPSGEHTFLLQNSLFIDYQTLADTYAHMVTQSQYTQEQYYFLPKTYPINYFWADVHSLAAVHQVATLVQRQQEGTDMPLMDRFTRAETIRHDPLYVGIMGILGLECITLSLVIILGSSILLSLALPRRLIIFAVLRAIGSSLRTLSGIIVWEQGIRYILVFGLGIGIGGLFSLLAIPRLMVTDVALVTGAFDLINYLPPIHLVLPALLWLLLALLIGVGLLIVIRMVIFMIRALPGQLLRLHAD